MKPAEFCKKQSASILPAGVSCAHNAFCLNTRLLVLLGNRMVHFCVPVWKKAGDWLHDFPVITAKIQSTALLIIILNITPIVLGVDLV